MEKLYEEKWYQRGQKEAILGKTTKWYRYQNRVVPVPSNRTQSVPVPIQVVPVPIKVVPVPPYRMCMVPVPNKVVPVPQLPKCPDFCNFAYLSLNSYIDSMRTLLND